MVSSHKATKQSLSDDFTEEMMLGILTKNIHASITTLLVMTQSI